MINLTDYFIPAPVSTFYTLVLGLSMAVVFDTAGRSIFKRTETWIRALYFFSGLLVTAWVLFLLSLLGFANILLLRLIAAGFVLVALVLSFKNRDKLFTRNIVSALRYDSAASFFARLVMVAVYVTLLAFLIMSLAPPTDADSLDYHLGIPIEILRAGSIWFDKNNLHFRLVGFGEMINLLGVPNGCPQLGAFMQFIALLWLLSVFAEAVPAKSKAVILALTLGIPALLFLIPAQKHQLTGIAATAICFYIISQKANLLDKKLLSLLILTILFAVDIKYSFLLSAFALLLLLLLKSKPVANSFILGRFTFWSVVFLGPLLYFKQVHFGDAFSPLLEHFRSEPDSMVVFFGKYLGRFHDSSVPFPFNLFYPASIGTVSTILGVGGLILSSSLLFYKKTGREIITIMVLIVLIAVFGQKSSRFFYEPYLWMLPLFVIQAQQVKWAKYFAVAGQLQLLLLIPFVLFGASILAPGLISDKGREAVMSSYTPGYKESKWIDSILPADAKICGDLRSKSLLSRPYVPNEYLLFTRANDSTQIQNLDRMLDEYRTEYIILPGSKRFDGIRQRYAGELIGSSSFSYATRNPFNRRTYVLSIYKIK
jgi:hypothetical protein